MSEELSQEVIVETGEQVQAPQYSDVEQAAIEKGWRPKEDYTGDPTKWRSAETFLALDEPLKRIESQSKELKKVREALEALSSHHKKVKEVEYNRALKHLQDARKEAFRNGETEQAFQIEERIEELKTEKENIIVPDVPQEPTIAPEFQEWVEANSWYQTSKTMRAAADAIGIELHSQGLTSKQVLKQVEEEIKKEFPHKFQNPKTTKPNTVEASSRGSPRQSESIDLSPDERKIMESIVRTGIMTKEQYLKELKATKGT
jgi:hypothetical protein